MKSWTTVYSWVEKRLVAYIGHHFRPNGVWNGLVSSQWRHVWRGKTNDNTIATCPCKQSNNLLMLGRAMSSSGASPTCSRKVRTKLVKGKCLLQLWCLFPYVLGCDFRLIVACDGYINDFFPDHGLVLAAPLLAFKVQAKLQLSCLFVGDGSRECPSQGRTQTLSGWAG